MQRTGGMIAILAIVATQVAAAGAATVDEIVAKNVKALGGEAAIAKLKTISKEGTLFVESEMMGEMEGIAEAKAIMGERAWMTIDMGVFYQTSAWQGGDKGWADDAMSGLREISGDELTQVRSQASVSPLIGYRAAGIEVSVLDDAKIHRLGEEPEPAPAGEEAAGEEAAAEEGPAPIDCHVLEMGSPDSEQTVRVYVDKDSGLIVQMRMEAENEQFGLMETIIENAEYAEHGGVKIIKVMKLKMGDLLTMTMDYESIEVNGEIDDEVFAMPVPPAPPAAPAAAAPAEAGTN